MPAGVASQLGEAGASKAMYTGEHVTAIRNSLASDDAG